MDRGVSRGLASPSAASSEPHHHGQVTRRLGTSACMSVKGGK